MSDSLRTAGCALLAAALLAGCDRIVTTVTTERAPWSYVEDAWGGMALGDAAVSADRITLPLRLDLHPATRVDSGICMCGTAARVDGQRILVSINQCVCGPGAGVTREVSFPRPASGVYSVVYDDEEAGFPTLGDLEVP